jgi:glucose-1-phosphate adenylyltransferase
VESALAMILAGGHGRRMGILCQHRAKPILPFAGYSRVIDCTLSNCLHSQIKDIAVVADYQRSAVATYLQSWFLTNDASRNFSILEPRDGSYLGTADAVYQNLEFVESHGDDTIMVLAGDHIYKMDYRKMLAFHRQMGADATVGVVRVPAEEAHRFGIVTVDGQAIVDFVEKPTMPQSNLVSMGIYVFNKQVLTKRLIEDAALQHSAHDFGHAILPGMMNRDKVYAYNFGSYWRDIGNPEAYYEANMELLLPELQFSLDGMWPILAEANCLPQRSNFQQGSIRNSLVSPGCVIKGEVGNSIISCNVWVEEKAEIRNSIVMANSFVGYHSVVDHCILDERVNIGKFCYLGSGNAATSEKRKVTVVGEGVTIPPYTAIGCNCKIVPNMGPDDFKDKVVLSNSVLSPR